MFVILLLAACDNEKVDLDTGEAPLADLGDPFVGLYAAAAPGTFRSDCQIDIELYADEEQVAGTDMYAIGGEWTGVTLPGSVQYRAVATWESCTTGPDGTGQQESSVFSGVKGDFFVFHYNGVVASFDSLVQRTDFEGGVAEITFDEGTEADDAEASFANVGVEGELVDGTTYRVTWDSEKAVGQVLTDFSKERYYYGGSPVWMRTPDWW